MKTIVEEAVTFRKTAVPLTGNASLESLNDGREVWIYGEKVKDVTKHPAFRNSCRIDEYPPKNPNPRAGESRLSRNSEPTTLF
jgi:4-hydroxyphenylacetate 3-hydroxylase N terminal